LLSPVLIIAPILGVVAGGSIPNLPGNGPGTGQVIVGVRSRLLGVHRERCRGVRRLEACIWALVSLALTGGLILSFILLATGIA